MFWVTVFAAAFAIESLAMIVCACVVETMWRGRTSAKLLGRHEYARRVGVLALSFSVAVIATSWALLNLHLRPTPPKSLHLTMLLGGTLLVLTTFHSLVLSVPDQEWRGRKRAGLRWACFVFHACCGLLMTYTVFHQVLGGAIDPSLHLAAATYVVGIFVVTCMDLDIPDRALTPPPAGTPASPP